MLLYYRVRDHLRGIGLGRKGLAVLLERETARTMAEFNTKTRENISAVIPEADYEALRRLWTSAAVAKEERGLDELDRLV
jgi:hypothetical protein